MIRCIWWCYSYVLSTHVIPYIHIHVTLVDIPTTSFPSTILPALTTTPLSPPSLPPPTPYSVLGEPKPTSNIPAYNVALDRFAGIGASIRIERLAKHARVEEAIWGEERNQPDIKKKV